MAIFSGPEIVQNGLVLALDAANARSFRGEPTTNIISNGDFSNGLTDWTNYTAVTTSVVTRYDVPGYLNQPKTVARVVSPGTVQGGGTFGGFARSVTMTSGLAYTISYYARSLSGNMTLGFNSQSGSGDTNNLSHSNTINATWQRYTFTATLNTAKPTMYIYNSGTANGIWELTDFQIEQKSYATAFTNGTRDASWLDISGNSNNGQQTNGPQYNSLLGGYLTFDGTDDYISGNLPAIAANSRVTAEAVVRFDNVSGTIFTHGQSGSSFSFGLVIVGGNLRFRNSSNDHWLSNPQTLVTNQWYHLVITADENGAAGYVNAVSNGTTTQKVTTNNFTDYNIGRRPVTNSEFFPGSLMLLRIYYNRALTATEVLQNYNATRSRFGL